MMFNFLEKIPNYLWMKIKRVNGQIIEINNDSARGDNKIGIVIVPRNFPSKSRIMKTEEGNFGEVLNKLRKKEDDDNDNNLS